MGYTKEYLGYCGSCVHCDLSNESRSWTGVIFKCTRNNYQVKADEKTCRYYEIARGRSNEIIQRYVDGN